MHPRALRPSPPVQLFWKPCFLSATLLFAIVLTSGTGWALVTNCPTEPAQNTPIVSGQTYSGSNCVLNTTGDVDSFQFTGSAGDIWRSVVGLGSSATNICMDLYNPSATRIFHGCTSLGYPNYIYSVATDQKLTVDGAYTIVITEGVMRSNPMLCRWNVCTPRHRTPSLCIPRKT